MSRPRVLHVINLPRTVPLFAQPIAEALRQAGWDNAVASPTGPELESLERAGLPHHPLPVSRELVSPKHAATCARLVGLIRRGGYDLLHLHGIAVSTIGRVAAAITGRRAVYYCHGTYYEGGGALASERMAGRAWPAIERALAPFTAWAFTMNEDDRRDLIERAGMSPERVTCLGVGACGVDLEAWDPARFPRSGRDATRARLGIPSGAFVVGFVGRLVREKGVLELVEALARLRREGVDAELLMVGGTWQGERDRGTAVEVRRRVAELGIERHVTLLDFQRQPMELVAAMDVLALPSHREGYGQVLVEAGALGVPVVAAASRGARHAVLHERTGLLVPVGDVAALTGALRRVAREPGLGARLGAAGMARAPELGRERVLGEIVDVYGRLARELRPGAPTARAPAS